MSWPQHPGWQVPPPAFLPPGFDPRFAATPGVFVPQQLPPWMTPQSPAGQQPSPQHQGQPPSGLSTPPGTSHLSHCPITHNLTKLQSIPGATAPLSRTHPSLHPVLSPDTTLVRFDVGVPPSHSITPDWFHTNRSQSAFTADQTGARPAHVRLLCKHPAAPWSIDIKAVPYGAREVGVTCEDIWGGIYAALQAKIADSEWGFIVKDKALVETVNKSIQKRVRADPGASRHPLRIDCLGDAVLFRGMEKDEEYAKLRLMPTAEKVKETWVIRLTN